MSFLLLADECECCGRDYTPCRIKQRSCGDRVCTARISQYWNKDKYRTRTNAKYAANPEPHKAESKASYAKVKADPEKFKTLSDSNKARLKAWTEEKKKDPAWAIQEQARGRVKAMKKAGKTPTGKCVCGKEIDLTRLVCSWECQKGSMLKASKEALVNLWPESNSSSLEVKLADALKAKLGSLCQYHRDYKGSLPGLNDISLQYPFYSRDGKTIRWVLDLAIPARRILINVHGSFFHSEPGTKYHPPYSPLQDTAQKFDPLRRAYFNKVPNWTYVEIWESELENLEACVAKILKSV